MNARTLAARIRYAATTEQPSSTELTRARRITIACMVILLAFGLWSAATGTWQSTLVALFCLTAAGVCRYWLRTRLAR